MIIMKSPRLFLSLISAAALSLGTPVLRAQQPPTSDFGSVLANARGLAAANKLDEAEAALAAIGHSPANTPAGHMETAVRLTQLAFDLVRSSGNVAAADLAAKRALHHLDLVARAPNVPPGLAASALQHTGYIYERFYGDTAQAATSYQTATRLVTKRTQAAEALQRLNDADAAAKHKRAGNGG
jgi:hypothetical protein